MVEETKAVASAAAEAAVVVATEAISGAVEETPAGVGETFVATFGVAGEISVAVGETSAETSGVVAEATIVAEGEISEEVRAAVAAGVVEASSRAFTGMYNHRSPLCHE